LAQPRPRRIRHCGIRRLVQPSPPLPTLRRHPTGRNGGRLLRSESSPATRRAVTPISLRTRRGDSLIASLLAMARSMSESRKAIVDLLSPGVSERSGAFRVTFADPITDADVLSIDADRLTDTAELDTVASQLDEALRLLREVR